MDTMQSNTDVDGEQKPTSNEFFKKWHRTGFVSLAYWAHAKKVIIEIGSTDPDANNSLKGATKCFVPGFQFLAYLRAEVSNNTMTLFPNFEGKGISFFGGGNVKGQIVSRVFNSSIYGKQGVPDPMARTFTCAHYEGSERDKGVVIPNFKASLSKNTMKLNLTDLAEIFEVLHVQILTESLADNLLKENGVR